MKRTSFVAAIRAVVAATRRVHPLDAALVLCGLLFSAVSLAYPFGRDQGLYHYVGREWFHGALPYRDMMDQKTPVIYFVFGLANALFGEHLWSVRVLELAWVLSIGWVLGWAATAPKQVPSPGVRGTGSLLVCLLYFGVLGFWDTAQCEIWYAGFCFVSLCISERSTHRLRGPLGAGFWAGLACLAKPPAIYFAIVIVVAFAARKLTPSALDDEASTFKERARRTVVALALFGAGALIPLAVTLLYFGARGGLDDLYDVVIRCNLYYREHERPALDRAAVFDNVKTFWLFVYPFSLLAPIVSVVGLVFAYKCRDARIARRYLVALALPIAGICAVLTQGLFFAYHYGAFFASWAVAFVFAIEDIASGVPKVLTRKVESAWFSGAAAVLLVITYTTATYGPVNHSTAHYGQIKTVLAYLREEIPREEYIAHWNVPNFYDWGANVLLGEYIRDHSKPTDLVASRNFEPAIYAVAERSSGLRFFWTSWIAWNHRAYRREIWGPQDRAQTLAHPPRFVVAFHDARDGVESIQYFYPVGTWQERIRAAGMAVYERVSDTPTIPH